MIGIRKIDCFDGTYPIDLRVVKNNEFEYKLQYRLSTNGLDWFGKLKRFFNNMGNWEDVIVPIVRPNCENKPSVDKFYPSSHIKGYIFTIIKYSVNDIYGENGIFTNDGIAKLKKTYTKLADLPEFQNEINEFVEYYRKSDYERLPTIKKF